MIFNSPSHPRYSSVKTLLRSLFDYAGLFPPAILSMPEAIEEYLGHRAESDAWMMGPFVVPVSRLGEIERFAQDFPGRFTADSPVSFDVLLRSGTSMQKFTSFLEQDLQACSQFVENMAATATIDAMEFRLPADAMVSGDLTDGNVINGTVIDGNAATESFRTISGVIQSAGYGRATVFCEILRSDRFEKELPLYFLSLAACGTADGHLFGKLRCGGMSSADFPSPKELALFLRTAIRVGHAFKATAGLHHPIRHFNTAQQIMMHGFLNVFFASTLGRVHELSTDDIERIIEDVDPESFQFTDRGISWKHLEASTTDLILDRSSLGLSIGSCSFNEPREDLFKLGWLSS